MLVLSRKEGESIVIGDGDLYRRTKEGEFVPIGDILVTMVEPKSFKGRIGIEADKGVRIHRQEIWEEIHRRPYSRPTNQEGPGSQAPDGASPHRASA